MQNTILQNFTNLTRDALKTLSQQYIEYAQKNDVNFSIDLIKVPTGDGFLLAMPLEGLERPHLDFAIGLLKLISESNKGHPCDRYDKEGFCNCHPNFDLRVGIDEGKGLVYKDLNGNYNVVGKTINMTSRIMDLGDDKTILMGDDAYNNLIDITNDKDLEFKFRHHRHIKIKHDEYLDVHQYCQEDLDCISAKVPNKIQDSEKFYQIEKSCFEAVQSSGLGSSVVEPPGVEIIEPDKASNLEKSLAAIAPFVAPSLTSMLLSAAMNNMMRQLR